MENVLGNWLTKMNYKESIALNHDIDRHVLFMYKILISLIIFPIMSKLSYQNKSYKTAPKNLKKKKKKKLLLKRLVSSPAMSPCHLFV